MPGNFKNVRLLSSVLVFSIAALLGVVFVEFKMSKNQQSDWSNIISATQVGEVAIGSAAVPRVVDAMKVFADRERFEITSRIIHPTELWLSLDLRSERYKVFLTNSVHTDRFKIYVYVDKTKGGTNAGALTLLTSVTSALSDIR